jgi:hypothetical protein
MGRDAEHCAAGHETSGEDDPWWGVKEIFLRERDREDVNEWSGEDDPQ